MSSFPLSKTYFNTDWLSKNKKKNFLEVHVEKTKF